MSPGRARPRNRRAVVLLAVAVAIAVAALAAATLLFVAWAHVESGRRAAERAQLQAMAWSGVRGVMSELAAQRETLLLGGEPLLTPQWTLFEDGGVRGAVRLLPISGASVAMSEASKLDLATATPAMLAKLPGLEVEGDQAPPGAASTVSGGASRLPAGIDRSAPAQSRADRFAGNRTGINRDPSRARPPRVVGDRSDAPAQGPVQDDADANVPELVKRIIAARDAGSLASAEALGDVEGMTRDLLEGQEATRRAGMGGVRSISLGRAGLLDRVGVFASEPAASIGVTGGATDAKARGLERLAVQDGWDEAIAARARDRATDQAFVAIERILKAEAKPADESELVELLLKETVEPALIGEVLDLVTFGDDAYRLGRVDINHAPADTLAAIPGLDAEAAERVVQERGRLDADTLRRASWPLERGVLEPEAFALASRWITTRSLVWRVRIEATLTPMSRRVSEGLPRDASSMVAEADDAGDGRADAAASVPRVVYEAVIDASGPVVRVAYLRDVTLAGVARAVEERRAVEQGPDDEVSASTIEPEPTAELAGAEPPPLSRAERMRAERGEDDPASGIDAEPAADEEDASSAGDAATGTDRAPAARKDRRVGRWTRGRP